MPSRYDGLSKSSKKIALDEIILRWFQKTREHNCRAVKRSIRCGFTRLPECDKMFSYKESLTNAASREFLVNVSPVENEVSSLEKKLSRTKKGFHQGLQQMVEMSNSAVVFIIICQKDIFSGQSNSGGVSVAIQLIKRK